MIGQQILYRAAELLERDAEAMFNAHTLDGEWVIHDDVDAAAAKLHAETVYIATQLRAIAGRC